MQRPLCSIDRNTETNQAFHFRARASLWNRYVAADRYFIWDVSLPFFFFSLTKGAWPRFLPPPEFVLDLILSVQIKTFERVINNEGSRFAERRDTSTAASFCCASVRGGSVAEISLRSLEFNASTHQRITGCGGRCPVEFPRGLR